MLLNRERALEVMDKHDLDALVACTPENVYYLSDYGVSHSFIFALYGVSAAVFPRDESVPATLFVGEVDVPYLEEHPTWMPEVRMIESFGSYVPPGVDLTERERRVSELWSAMRAKGSLSPNRQEVMAGVLRELGLADARLGFDDVRAMLELQSAGIAESTGADAFNIFREIRLVKTPREIELLREAARINEECLQETAQLLTEGTVIGDLARRWKSSMALRAAAGIEFYAGGFDRPWIFGSGSYRLRDGDHVLLDGSGTYEHYWCDMGRTGCVGAPSGRVEELYGVLADCYEQCVPLLQPGSSTVTIKKAASEAVRSHMTDGFTPLLHPLGIELYDNPQPLGEIEREEFVLEAGMVVNLETALYVEFPWGVLQLEDTFLVREDGPESLVSLPRDLISPR